MLTMRFNRTGKKNRVSYRIVLQEHTVAPGKRHVEILGSHDPHSKTTVLKEERIQHWLQEGVQPSDAVYNLLVAKGLVTGAKRAKKMPRPEPKVEEAQAAPEVTEETPAEPVSEEAPVDTPQEEAAAESPSPEEAAKEAEATPGAESESTGEGEVKA